MFDARHSQVLSLIVSHAQNDPDKVALIVGERRISYLQLVGAVERAAAYLSSLGICRGDHIILSANKEVEFVYLYFAAHLMGVVNVVVDTGAPVSRLEYIADVVKPAAIFGANIKLDGYRCIDMLAIDLDSVNTDVPLIRDIRADDVADVMFTTGTLGQPKGVCLSHANLAASASNINSFIGNDGNDIEALALPMSHSFGLGRLRCVLVAGGTIVLVGNFANLKSLFHVIETEHVTGFGMVPAAWQYIKRLSGQRIARFANQLKYIEIGSAALPVEDKRLLMKLLPNTRLCMHYGLTEASRAIFSEFHHDADNLGTIGRPVSPFVEVCVLDETGNQVPDGIDGEICVKGNMVMRSYFCTQDNNGAFHGDWFRTGDWGHRDDQGNFYFSGRKKELINVGGEKVNPATIEDAIRSTGIVDCACIAIPDPNGVLGEVPKAFLQRGQNAPTIEEIKTHLMKVIPPKEIPAQWEWVDKIPRTSSGKIQRLKLKQ